MPANPSIAFRTPLPPRPIEPVDVAHPLVPAGLDGLTILHISDLHVRRNLLRTDRYREVLDALGRTPVDLVVLTGDYMDEPECEPSHERAALETLAALAGSWRSRLGAYAIFGNHDTPEFRRAAMQECRGITFIGGRTLDVSAIAESSHGATLRLLGLDWPEDFLALTLNAPPDVPLRSSSLDPFPIALAHHPNALIPAAELGIPLMFAGHTHAGQIRLHSRLAPHTSSDLPPHMASGILQLRSTLCCISRGLGDGVVEGLRINCPRQIPLYTLRKGGKHPGSELVVQHTVW